MVVWERDIYITLIEQQLKKEQQELLEREQKRKWGG